ncbi:hypothetical protein IWW36_004647, partial [Coemansia brasiliensis]
QRPVGRGGYRGRPPMRPEHREPPPPGYVCHRCGMQGHWIYSCPTMNQTADGTGKPGMHRVKRTTGIPKSFLQKVDNLDEVGNALVTSDGTLVVATANEAAWKTAQRMSRAAVSAEDIDESLVPEELKCNLCKKLARDAVMAPCCKTIFCSSCIENQLLEPGLMHFTCPQCRSGLVPDQLEVAKDIRGKVDEFLREFSSSQNVSEENEDKPGGDKPGGSANGNIANGSANGDKFVGSTSMNQAPSVATAAGTDVAAPAPTNIQRPPAQIPPRPRPMNMMPGMMFPGMPMPMGQMPFMPGMMPGMMPPLPPNSMGQWNNSAPADSAADSDKEMRSSRRNSSHHPRSRSRSSRHRSRSRGSRHRSPSRDSRDRRVRTRDDSRALRDSRSRREYSRDRSSSRRYRESQSRRRDDSRERRSSRYDDDRRGRRDRYRSGRSRSPAPRDHSSHSDMRSGRSRGSRHRRDEEVSIRGQSTGSTDKSHNIADRLNDTRSADTAKAQESSAAYMAFCWRPQLLNREFVPAEKQTKPKKHVLFVTAHPDDECMFFSPTMASLARRQDIAISLLCLSKGDFDGNGEIRKKELVKAAVSFGLTPDSVIIVDDPNLPDDPKKAWNVPLVARTVEAVVTAGDVDVVFTFDKQGVSGHSNHIAAYMGVKHMALTSQRLKLHPVHVYSLESVGLIRKYSSIIDTVFSLSTLLSRNGLMFIADVQSYSMGVQAMAMHESQLVWFRKIYLAFSRYMFINTYSKIN